MQEMKNPKQNPDQITGTVSLKRSVEMNPAKQTDTAGNAPLYSSPWLAFFYIIRQGWGQTRP